MDVHSVALKMISNPGSEITCGISRRRPEKAILLAKPQLFGQESDREAHCELPDSNHIATTCYHLLPLRNL